MTQAILRIAAVLALVFGGLAVAPQATALDVDPMATMAPSAPGDDCCDNQATDMDACLTACAIGCGLIAATPTVAVLAARMVWETEDRLAAGTAPSPFPGPPRV